MVHKIVHQLWSFINTVSEKFVQSKSMAFTIKQQASQSHTKEQSRTGSKRLSDWLIHENNRKLFIKINTLYVLW